MSLVWGLLLQRMLLEVCCHSNLAGGNRMLCARAMHSRSFVKCGGLVSGSRAVVLSEVPASPV